LIALAAVVSIMSAPLVMAQGWTLISMSGQDYNFSVPGARSLAMGGAFVGLADDATAAYANPAGLTVLLQPEVSLEGRSWDSSFEYFRGGRFDGEWFIAYCPEIPGANNQGRTKEMSLRPRRFTPCNLWVSRRASQPDSRL
jgi:hypothetical protein